MNREAALTILKNKAFTTQLQRDYRVAIEALEHPGIKVKCGKRIDNPDEGKHTSISWLRDVVRIFKRLDFHMYTVGNDAPRKGKHGDYIIVIK